jgi:hypothetical protein
MSTYKLRKGLEEKVKANKHCAPTKERTFISMQVRDEVGKIDFLAYR